ncbi:YtfJ family protein [Serratia liquefaciens]|uniref:YtfJ family protein n=1 Tax=Serratia liquefaciens TaxID=614 RepID=UPI002182A6B6|nr:YtfJ family protein [Serratia liquefaciens]CAI2466142.1 Predicted transcriptional regulator [Serratia liquefaciens]
MMLRRLLPLSLLLLPLMASAHNFVQGKPVVPVVIGDRGELLLENDTFSYKKWDSAELAGKVRVIQCIAGRTSAKKKNSMLITAVKEANFPNDRFQPTTIVNTDDAIPGTGFFVRGKIEKNKRHYPWAQFIVDSDGLVRQAWQLPEESSTILVLDKQGRVQWAKDGALTPDEVNQVIALLQKLISHDQS